MREPLPADPASLEPIAPAQAAALMARRFRGYLPVAIDVECGGFNPATDALLEIAATLIDMDTEGVLKRGLRALSFDLRVASEWPDANRPLCCWPFSGPTQRPTSIRDGTRIRSGKPSRLVRALRL